LKEAKEKHYNEKRELMIKTQKELKENPVPAKEDIEKKNKEEKDNEIRSQGEYNAKDDFQYIVKQGSRNGYHFMLYLNSFSDIKQTALKLDMFRHRLAFTVSDEDSRELFGNKYASSLPEHICQYYNTMERFSFRPYLHNEIGWEGWDVDNNGNAVSPFTGN
jgi:hypothetical protein